MFVEINGQNVFYERKKGKGTPVLLLHGWGCGASAMRRIFDCFAALGRDVTAIDFPGFGKSFTPPETFTVFDYADYTQSVIEKLELKKPDVIAHSFGGRVAIILASEGKINRLVLTDAAGLKPRRGLKYRFKVTLFKLKRKLGIEDKNAGSEDYRSLSPEMKRVFTAVVNAFLDDYLDKIKCPTLLIWGSKDRDTPIRMAKKMEKHIPDCGLAVFDNCGHFCFQEEPLRFNAVVTEFFKED